MGKLTNSQKSIWVTEQYYKGSSVNNICGTAIIDEKVDFEKLRKSIEIVCKKHDNFKLQINIKNDGVKQVISELKEIQIDTINVASKKELTEEREKIVKKTFKLENSKLFKFYIFKFENGEGAFMLNIHHLISDAWTLAFICNEIIKTYSALKQNKEIETKAIYSYIDYIKSEQQYLESEKYQKDKLYWEEQFATIPEVATIPGSKENADETNPAGARKQFNLDIADVEKIKEYCKQNKISLYNFFMAIYSIYIGEISNQDEFIIGTPILNRTNFKEKNAAGMFINMAPFKINMKQDMDFKEFTTHIAIDTIKMLKHQKYSYQCLLENLREKNKSIPNLYNILLSYQITNAQMSGGDVKYKTEWTFNGCCAENIDIQIYDLNDTGSLNIAYDYKTSIYEQKDIENLHKRILNIISQVITKQQIKIKDIEIVTPEEKEQLVIEFNKTELKYDSNIPVIKYFEEQVNNNPDNIAVVFENKKMTYKELNERANSLAYELRENGVTNNTIVGILQERSFEMIIAILGVLKSGGCYIPIAPDYPDERIKYMLEDSKANILLANGNLNIETEKKVINIKLENNKIYNNNKGNLINISKPEDLSYMIYTSGSTGTPKGVMLKQQNLSNFYNSMKETIRYLKDGRQHKILSITTVSFDIFEFESLISLTRGLTVYMTNENEQKMTSEIEKIIKNNKIEIMQTTPSIMKFHLDNIKDRENLQSLKYIVLAGEPLPKILVDKIKSIIPDVTIYNGYGPSETTIFSTTADVTKQSKITIGKPIHNTQIYILNANKKLMPQGTIGEIYISGDGVGKGYMNKEEQTQMSFIQNPFIKGMTMYKVGDLGAFNENGEIICYGRVDHQVKIRGLRIELSEIEKQILSLSNISDCVVVKKQIDGKDTLCAYYVENQATDKNIIKKILYAKLPQYMIPQYFIKLEKIPHTPNGKIDRKLLPEPDLEDISRAIVKPRNETDEELIKIIEKMLHIEQVSIEDTLLDLGGDSLTGITLSTKILSKFNVQVNIKDILSNFTIKDISDYIRKNQSDSTENIRIEKAPEQDTYPLSSAQKRIYYNVKMIGDENTVYNITWSTIIDEILDRDRVQKVIDKIVERHGVLRTSFIIENNNVVQKINKSQRIKISTFENTEREINNIIKNFVKPFKLEESPLLRVELHYIDNEKTLLLLDTHHIIMDGTSLNNLAIEFNRLYNGSDLKNIPIEYKDYAVWEEKYNNSDSIKKIEKYWINKFKDCEFTQINLPYDYNMPSTRNYEGDKISKKIDEKKFNKIRRYTKKIGVSPYMFFLSILYVLLYKYSGQKDINIGSPIANRNINETKRMFGMFVNNIVLRGQLNPEETFEEFLNKIKEQLLDDLTHQPYPFDMLVKKLKIDTDVSRNPLFDILFTYQNKQETVIKLDDKEVKVETVDNNTSKFNLSLEIQPKTHIVNIEYRTDLFKKQTIENLFNHYMNTIDFVMNNLNTKIKDIEIISDEEKKQIILGFNNTKKEYPEKPFSMLFEEQARLTPNNVALVFEDEKLTYKELNEKSNSLAYYLRNVKKVNREDTVGIMINRSLEMVIAILGVMKAGGVYIPIDPNFPEDRINYMLETSASSILLTSKKLESKINYKNKVTVDLDNDEIYMLPNDNIENVNELSDLLYIIFTSGSTGKPKGVMQTQRTLVNFAHYCNDHVGYLREPKNQAIVSISTVSFDIFSYEALIPLQKGVKVIIANENEQTTPKLLNDIMIKNKITATQATPSVMQMFVNSIESIPYLRQIKYLTLTGEQVPIELVKKLKDFSNITIYNGYGPTETYYCTLPEIQEDVITIGKPFYNDQMYILDNNLKPVPIGVVGEIYIAGDGLARGYLNNKELTEKSFIKNPFIENKLMYKSGDLGKYLENGNIICLGRSDNQIKIRGLRIELRRNRNIDIKIS